MSRLISAARGEDMSPSERRAYLEQARAAKAAKDRAWRAANKDKVAAYESARRKKPSNG